MRTRIILLSIGTAVWLLAGCDNRVPTRLAEVDGQTTVYLSGDGGEISVSMYVDVSEPEREEDCPIIHATVSVDGVELKQTQFGGDWDWWGGDCGTAAAFRATVPRDEPWPPKTVVLKIADDSLESEIVVPGFTPFPKMMLYADPLKLETGLPVPPEILDEQADPLSMTTGMRYWALFDVDWDFGGAISIGFEDGDGNEIDFDELWCGWGVCYFSLSDTVEAGDYILVTGASPSHVVQDCTPWKRCVADIMMPDLPVRVVQ